MKKILTALACTAILVSSASADAMKIEGGAGVWQQTPKGDITYTETGYDGKYESNEDKKDKAYVWMLIKHPLPIVPNLRLEYVGIEDKGDVTGKFKDYDITAGIAKAKLTMEQYDIIPYYNIIDNLGWTTVDVGLDFKIIDTSYDAEGTIDGVANSSYSDSSTVVIPLLYLRARVEFPKTGLAVEGDAKYIGYGKTHVIDTRAKVDYTLDFVPVVQPAIEVGYRIQSYKFDEDDQDAKLDLTFSGFYAGIMLRY